MITSLLLTNTCHMHDDNGKNEGNMPRNVTSVALLVINEGNTPRNITLTSLSLPVITGEQRKYTQKHYVNIIITTY
jgi:hypothetical protein